MTLSNLWAVISGAKQKEANDRFDMAYRKLMAALDNAEGEQRAKETLRNLGAMMRGHGNGAIAKH